MTIVLDWYDIAAIILGVLSIGTVFYVIAYEIGRSDMHKDIIFRKHQDEAKIQKATKDHWCDDCQQVIHEGSNYVRAFVPVEGQPYPRVFRFHVGCSNKYDLGPVRGLDSV